MQQRQRSDDPKDAPSDRPLTTPGADLDELTTIGRAADDAGAPPYQTLGAGGLDFSDRGAATADEASTGGEIATEIGEGHSTGGMPKGMTIGSDVGLMGTTTGRGTGTFGPGRSGDMEEGSVSERGAPVMGSTSGSGASVGGGASSTGGATAPIDPTPDRVPGD